MRLASIFCDHMVLQKGLPIRVFGNGAGCVTVSFLGHTVTESFDTDEWCVSLPSFDYGGPYEMEVVLNGEATLIRDIYVGEVWIASGQSNMEMPLFRTEYGFTEAKHSYNEKIRLFDVPRRVERDVQKYGWPFVKTDGADTPWSVCFEESVLKFSAMGYYVAKELQEKLGVAVGIIGCNWGSRRLETFISRDFAHRLPSLKRMLDDYNKLVEKTDKEAYRKELDEMYAFIKMRVDEIDYDEVERARERGLQYTRPIPMEGYPACYKPGPNHPDGIGVLYESMVSRIVPFGVGGFIWYQGESNGGDYDDKYGVFMECMKERFLNPKMKFYSVEIASHMYGSFDVPDNRYVTDPTNKAFTREAQRRAAERFSDNHIVTSMQLGDILDIHPLNKAPLAHRMVLKMLKYSYGFDIKCEEPKFESAEFRDGKAYIKLSNAEGLMSPKLGAVKMFIADQSRELKRAEITIDGDTLILSNPEVKEPILARYAFDNFYLGEFIYNDAGLPLAPFRTDYDIT